MKQSLLIALGSLFLKYEAIGNAGCDIALLV